MSATSYQPSINMNDSRSCSHLTQPPPPKSQSVVNHYYIDGHSQPFLPTPNISIETFAPNARPNASMKRLRDGRCLSRYDAGQPVVDPYDRRHQGVVQPISASAERDLTSDAVDFHRRQKLARLEPLSLAEAPAPAAAELRALREQYESLRRVVEETRAELQRSRAESNAAREAANRTENDFRVEIAQVTKHVQLLDGRQSALEKSVGDLHRTEALVSACREDIAGLRADVGRSAAAIAVMERSIAEIGRNAAGPMAQAGRSAQEGQKVQTVKPMQSMPFGQETGQPVRRLESASPAGNEVPNGFSFVSAAKPPVEQPPTFTQAPMRDSARVPLGPTEPANREQNKASPFGGFTAIGAQGMQSSSGGQPGLQFGSAPAPAAQQNPFSFGGGKPEQANGNSGGNSNANANANGDANKANFFGQTASQMPFGTGQTAPQMPFGTGQMTFAQPLGDTFPFSSSPPSGDTQMLGTRARKKTARQY